MPATHAEASRQRRDIVSGEVMDEDRLIRFAAAPDGAVVPDLARKLPGRGLWVAADRASVDAAAKKGLFSRAAKTKLTPGADLADRVEALLMRRLLDGLGLARRAGSLTCGFEKVLAAVRAGKAAWLIEAGDGAADGRRKIAALARHQDPAPEMIGVFSSAELDLALGGENVIHSAFLAGRGADRWGQDVLRLAGFRPLWPQSWREET
jgi:predicted RNA-binding protein YlxR (DUF448 family)